MSFAVWALGNVAGDSPKCDFVLGHGALGPLLAQLNEHAKLSMLRNATWTLSNFCRGKPQPAFEQTRPALPVLQQLIHSTDEEVLTDACWALSYLSDGTNDKIQAVIDSGVCPRLVELLLHISPSVLIPALRTVGNIVTGDDLQTAYIISNNALSYLLNLLTGTSYRDTNISNSHLPQRGWVIS
ncbi:Inositol monophosphatase 1 [Castilleja foliolosa]|uniref:Inositol monophosphatase 1 n=1 Tax=Castilleja foliolosa TaxID=1961234 RepID=A0ABD3BKA2_9LAMI